MAGARVTMMTSELLRNGVHRIEQIVDELNRWGDAHEYESVQQMCGSISMRNVADPDAYVRGNYMKMLGSWQPDPAGVKLW